LNSPAPSPSFEAGILRPHFAGKEYNELSISTGLCGFLRLMQRAADFAGADEGRKFSKTAEARESLRLSGAAKIALTLPVG
jgi:hypothetical protein